MSEAHSWARGHSERVCGVRGFGRWCRPFVSGPGWCGVGAESDSAGWSVDRDAAGGAHPFQGPARELSETPVTVVLQGVVGSAEQCEVCGRGGSAVAGGDGVVDVAAVCWGSAGGGSAVEISRGDAALHFRGGGVSVDGEDVSVGAGEHALPYGGGVGDACGCSGGDGSVADEGSDAGTGDSSSQAARASSSFMMVSNSMGVKRPRRAWRRRRW